MMCDGELFATSAPSPVPVITRQPRLSTLIIVGMHMADANLAQSVWMNYTIAADMARRFREAVPVSPDSLVYVITNDDLFPQRFKDIEMKSIGTREQTIFTSTTKAPPQYA